MKKKLVFYSLFVLVIGTTMAFTILSPKAANTEKFVVVLDAGHGGHDPGNRGNGYIEKNIALKVVLSIGKILEEDGRFKVIYTRKTDKFIELFERGKIANKAEADLFVSIHCNAHRSKAYGTETFVLGLHANNKNFEVAKNENSVILLEDNYKQNYDGFDPNSPESIIGLTLLQEEYLDQSLNLASVVQNQFTGSLKRKSRGVKQAGFIVLHQTYMPSVLIELGFLTNDREGKYLNSKKGQDEMAKAITKSIIVYKESLDANYFIPEPEVVKEVVDSSIVTTSADTIQKVEPEVNEVTIDTLGGEIYKDVVFKVQISASSTDLPLDPNNFNGLDQLSKKQFGTVYKYYYGATSNYAAIKVLRDNAIKKGFDSSFVVAFRDATPVPLSEVLKPDGSSH